MDKLSEPEISKSSQVHETVQPHLSQIQNAPLKLGDIVKFYDDSDRPVNGIVRWIGRNRDVLRSGSRIVGIETVSFFRYCIHQANTSIRRFFSIINEVFP